MKRKIPVCIMPFLLRAAAFRSLRLGRGSAVVKSQYYGMRHNRSFQIATTSLLARSPGSKFDLEAIEAFEAQLQTAKAELNNELLLDADGTDEPSDDDNDVRSYLIPQELDKKRIDVAISKLEPDLSRSHCGNLVMDGHVQMILEDGKVEQIDRKSFVVTAGAELRVTHPVDESTMEIVAQDIPLNILYEDEYMIVLNKAPGMIVHPGAGCWDGTVVNALAFYLAKSPYGSGDFVDSDGTVRPESGEGIGVEGTDGETISFRPGIVHRLDKGTTGVLVVAKTRQALADLSEAFQERNVKKTYMAITVGNPGRRVQIDKPIGRHPIHRQKMRVVPDPHRNSSGGRLLARDRLVGSRTPAQAGRRALSFVDTLAFDGRLSVVQVRIETGRTHQIRVHLQDRRTPIYGDDVYGLSDWNKQLAKTHQIARPLLHAYTLELDHPMTGQHMVFRAPLPEDMLRICKAIWPQGEVEKPELFHSDNSDTITHTKA